MSELNNNTGMMDQDNTQPIQETAAAAEETSTKKNEPIVSGTVVKGAALAGAGIALGTLATMAYHLDSDDSDVVLTEGVEFDDPATPEDQVAINTHNTDHLHTIHTTHGSQTPTPTPVPPVTDPVIEEVELDTITIDDENPSAITEVIEPSPIEAAPIEPAMAAPADVEIAEIDTPDVIDVADPIDDILV